MRKIAGRPDLAVGSDEWEKEMAISLIELITVEAQKGVPDHVMPLMSIGMVMMNQNFDSVGQTLAQSIAMYGYVSRQVELQEMTAALDDARADFFYSLYNTTPTPEGEVGLARTIGAAASRLPFSDSHGLPRGLTPIIPGWPAAFREKIARAVSGALTLDAENNGQGSSVPNERERLEAFCYGFMIHIFDELTPYNWLEGIESIPRASGS